MAHKRLLTEPNLMKCSQTLVETCVDMVMYGRTIWPAAMGLTLDVHPPSKNEQLPNFTWDCYPNNFRDFNTEAHSPNPYSKDR